MATEYPSPLKCGRKHSIPGSSWIQFHLHERVNFYLSFIYHLSYFHCPPDKELPVSYLGFAQSSGMGGSAFGRGVPHLSKISSTLKIRFFFSISPQETFWTIFLAYFHLLQSKSAKKAKDKNDKLPFKHQILCFFVAVFFLHFRWNAPPPIQNPPV